MGGGPFLPLALVMGLVGGMGLLEAWAWRRFEAGGAAGGAPLAWTSVAFTAALVAVPWSGVSPIGLALGAAGLVALAMCLPRVMRAAKAGLAGEGEAMAFSARPALGLAVLLGAAKVWGLLAGLGIVLLGGMPEPPPDLETTAQAFLLMMALGMVVSWALVMWPVWRGPWAGGRAALRAVRRGGVLVAAMAGWMLLSFLQGLSGRVS
jgi:hypothetical protein